MPNSQPSIDDPKPRVRGDMYLRAEQRRRTETAPPELTEIRTPEVPPVYQAAPSESSPAVLAPIVAVVPPVFVGSQPTPAAVEAPAITHQAPAVPAPVPKRTGAPARRASRHLPTRRLLVPVAAFGAVAIAATFAVTLSLSPGGKKESPVVTPAAKPSRAPNVVTAPAQPAAAAPALAPSVKKVPPPSATAGGRPAVVRVARATPVKGALEGQIRITSTPAGARVTVNGIGRGQTPVTVTHLQFGVQTVRLTRDGYASKESVVRVSGDDPEKALSVTLTARR